MTSAILPLIVAFVGQAQEPESPRLPVVQVLDSSRAPTDKELALARELTKEEFEELRRTDSRKGFLYKSKAFVLIDPKHPMIQPIADEIELIRAMPSAGMPTRFGDMPKSGQEALRRVLDSFGNPIGAIPQDSIFVLRAQPTYELNIGGKKVYLDVPVRQGIASQSLTMASFGATPTPAPRGGAPTSIKRQAPDSLAIVFPSIPSQRLLRFELATAAIKFMSDMANELASERTRRQSEWLKQLLEANKGFLDEVPRGGGSLDQLPAPIRDRLMATFTESYRAFGYDSEESARAAWQSATLMDAYMQFDVVFAYGGSGPNTLTGYGFGRTKG